MREKCSNGGKRKTRGGGRKNTLKINYRILFSVLGLVIAGAVIVGQNKAQASGPEIVGGISLKLWQENGKMECNVSSEACREHSEEFARKDRISTFLGGYPMEKMIPSLLKLDERVAAFLVAIAKKESDWGLHVPLKNGKDCFNYWGYKGSYNLAPSGYSCFDSPEQAVKIVGGKIGQLLDKGLDTPEKLVVWKCGSSCAGHSSESVRSWIGTVRSYYEKLK